MHIDGQRAQPTNSGFQPTIQCPNCGLHGTFSQGLGSQSNTINTRTHQVSIHKCPNVSCKAIVYFILDKQNQIVETFPHLRLKFDKSEIPLDIANSLEEAITCHSHQCYIASAIMVRKTLELICEERQATGKNLKTRIDALKGKIVIPEELLDGIHELRFLGNDAAHVESKIYKNIGKDELEIAIEFTKQILQAIYQYKKLLSQLQSLKS